MSQQPRKPALDLARLTGSLVGTFEGLFNQAGVYLSVQCSRLPRPAHVDSDMWERVVRELLANAHRFTPKGGVEVTLADRGGEIELTVADTGVGIPSVELPRIFESGGGLAVAEELVTVHGGKIRVSSKEGLGTTVTVTMPYGEEGSGAPSPDQQLRRAVLEALHEGVFLAHGDGTVFEVNTAWAATVGFGQQGAPYRPPYPWWPNPDTAPKEAATARAAHAHLFGGGPGTFEVPFRHADGHRVWVSLTVTRVSQPGAELFVGTIRDVTRDRRAAEQDAALTAMLTDLAAAVDTDGVLAAVTAHVGELFDGVAVATAWDDRRSEVAARTKAGRHSVGRLPAGLRAGLDRLREVAIELGTGSGAVAGTGARLRTSGDPHGAFWVEFPRARALSAEERLLVPVVADSIGHALARARRSDVQELISDRLQQSMLGPQELPAGFAARYLPIDDRFRVGGDWYDAVALAGPYVGVIVGDCVGRGLEAATAMGHLRDAARALLLSTADPAATLEALDRFAESVPGAECATAVCFVIDTESGELDYCNAGHLRPLLRTADGVISLEGGAGLPLATVASNLRTGATARLEPGDTLVVFSDGLVERRTEDITDGLERVAKVLGAITDPTPAGTLDALVQAEAPADRREDDVVIVAYRQADLPQGAPPGPTR
jgi:PAS domain S-box-containing protein